MLKFIQLTRERFMQIHKIEDQTYYNDTYIAKPSSDLECLRLLRAMMLFALESTELYYGFEQQYICWANECLYTNFDKHFFSPYSASNLLYHTLWVKTFMMREDCSVLLDKSSPVAKFFYNQHKELFRFYNRKKGIYFPRIFIFGLDETIDCELKSLYTYLPGSMLHKIESRKVTYSYHYDRTNMLEPKPFDIRPWLERANEYNKYEINFIRSFSFEKEIGVNNNSLPEGV